MSATSFNSQWKVTLVASSVALVLFAMNDRIDRPIRTTVRDAISPGERSLAKIVGTIREKSKSLLAPNRDEELNQLAGRLNDYELKIRRIELDNQRLRDNEQRLRKVGVPISKSRSSDPLFDIELITATVLGETASAVWRSGKLIDVGKTEGATETALVINSTGMLIDQGQDVAIAPDLPVYCGRCVVGKVEHVGRWSSTIQALTDRDFRELVVVARSTDQGLVFGPQGQLEGTGEDECRLTLVSIDEPVAAGDFVYSIPKKGMIEYPMLFGTVVQAEPVSGSSHWSITVKPAVDLERVKTVQVLRSRLNPSRMLGN